VGPLPSIRVERAPAPHGSGQTTPRRYAARTALPTKRATSRREPADRSRCARRLAIWFAGSNPVPSQHRTYAINPYVLMSWIADAGCACDLVGRNSDPRLDHAEEGSSVAAPAVHVQGRGAVGDAG
jgi:hypothetical protein